MPSLPQKQKLHHYCAQHLPESGIAAVMGVAGVSASAASSLSWSDLGLVITARCNVAAMLRVRSAAVAVRPRMERLGLVGAIDGLGDVADPS